MSANGKRRPRRPEITSVSPPASEAEAAAIAAALEQFLLDTAPAVPAGRQSQSPWQQAALNEAVMARRPAADPWGQPPW